MLQQTQTRRVSEKFLNFVRKFPNFKALSESSLEEVLKAWQGLGYNRRAIALKKIAETVITEYEGILPDSIEILKSFPQIGHNTASSIAAFAFNKPSIFIETNIRRVYIYFFFPQKQKVDDKNILPIVKKTIDNENPREWYYALMDYGVMLKKKYPELNKRSRTYRKQSQFKGSDREVRGKILKLILNHKSYSTSKLIKKLEINQNKLTKILVQLQQEGFIQINDDLIIMG
ncbi:MAG: A/G-specific adenine glycosylase [Promethearchaeota archaeon]